MLEKPCHFAAIPVYAQVVLADPNSQAGVCQAEYVGTRDLWYSCEEESFEVGFRKFERDAMH